jgi:signal transduction histidine kinase
MRATVDGVRTQADEVRRVAPVFALAAAVAAAFADPAPAAEVVLAFVPVAAFGLWLVRPQLPLALPAALVLVPVVIAQRDGALEPSMFAASVLAFVAARFASPPAAIAIGALCVATPPVVALVQDPSQVSVGVWILGILFPLLVGYAVRRQADLAAQLEATRAELAEQALLEERRRIARDVHDFVGHGLAAVMLQITSARHVLRRDPGAAEDALRSAEEVGRRSMAELRRTVALLRSEGDATPSAPVPTAAEIPALVDHARAGGLAVELRTRGDLGALGGGVGVAAYRIAQEALANAARHAPKAHTTLALELANGHVALSADTVGPVLPVSDPDRPRYGVIGMRERAVALGGELTAGPTDGGWRVSASLPLERR